MRGQYGTLEGVDYPLLGAFFFHWLGVTRASVTPLFFAATDFRSFRAAVEHSRDIRNAKGKGWLATPLHQKQNAERVVCFRR